MSKYTTDYFIAKFEAIPEEDWCIEEFEKDRKHCALGHCGNTEYNGSIEGAALVEIFFKYGKRIKNTLTFNTSFINDGINEHYQQLTPKQRILAALRDIKAKEDAK